MGSLFRKEWTPEAADSWTKEDIVAAILGLFCFVAIVLGTIYAFLLEPVGFGLLALAILLGLATLRLGGSKLSAVSTEYEKKQQKNLESLERIMRWEDDDG
jgi:hypothetical protein